LKPKGKKSLNIELALWKALVLAKSETGKALHVLMEEAWSAYTAAPSRQGASQPQSPADSAHKEWHAKLERIMSSGHDVAIKAVTENLLAFERLVEVDTVKPHSRKKVG